MWFIDFTPPPVLSTITTWSRWELKNFNDLTQRWVHRWWDLDVNTGLYRENIDKFLILCRLLTGQIWPVRSLHKIRNLSIFSRYNPVLTSRSHHRCTHRWVKSLKFLSSHLDHVVIVDNTGGGVKSINHTNSQIYN